MAVKYWLPVAQRVAISLLYQTSAASSKLLKLFAIRNTFKVYERLKKEQHIETLFRTGKAFSVFPIRLIWLLSPRPASALSPALTGFSVPKKKFPRSVDRHHIRRLMVESWRTNKQKLYEVVPPGYQLHLFFIFTDTTMPDFEIVRGAVVTGSEKLAQKLMEQFPNPESLIPNS